MTDPAREVQPSDIAIVGIALRFPGAHGPAEFWENLRRGTRSLVRFTDAELAARGVSRRLLSDPAYVKAGHVLEGVDLFDAEFFGFGPRDAAILDPQHRHFLECAWEALEDAGHPPGTVDGPIGVFGGCGMSSYFAFNLLTRPELVESVGLFLLRHTGNDKDFLTTRVSYCLDLKGPSVSIQTACSTSLVAVHAACQSLISGECELALAGGVTIEIPHGVGYLAREGEILAPDGICRPFDRAARGTCFGSGAGIVALRRASDALRDGDRIYALIKGSAVNNDGAGKVGYLAPSVDGQAAAAAEALGSAGIDADQVGYVEAHGSGTPIGEPIEVAALTQAFARTTSRKGYCGIGSVKANIGHLDTAAGVAGLIKAALCLHHGELPPTPGFECPNPAIPFADSPFRVIDRLEAWPRGAQPRRAAVNSLGVGGTNAHAVLEEAPARAASEARRTWQLLCLSARNQRALDDASRELAAHLRAHPEQELADVAFTLSSGRRGFEQRRVLCASGREEAAGLLETLDPRRVHTHAAGSAPPSLVFLLPGGGAQHPAMGRGLYETEPLFREHVDRGLDELRRRTKHDLRRLWLDPADAETAAAELRRPALQLPAIFILEYALAQLWMSLGARPAALLGHSLGENTAAAIAGVMSFEDALGLVALRGELFELLPEGGMLSVALPPDALAPLLGADLDLAAVNSPSLSVVSGRAAALAALERRLTAEGAEVQRIPIATAAHSRLVEPILARFGKYLRGIRLQPPRIPVMSNVSGAWLTDVQAVDPAYWVAHLRGTVQFSASVRALLEDPARLFLEVGPGRTLASLVKQHLAASRSRGALSSLPHAGEDLAESAYFLASFGRLWASGVAVERAFPWRGERRARVTLPTYPFQRRRCWIDPGSGAPAADREPTEVRSLDLLTEGISRPVWRARPLAPAPARAGPSEWLLFLDAAGVGLELAQRLRERGERVVTVSDGDVDSRLEDEHFSIAPERGLDGYTALLRALVAAGRMPQRIVHLWLFTPDESARPGSNFFHRNQERGFYSLVFLAQALACEGVGAPLHVSVVSNGMQALDGEALPHPAKATVLGPCRVIPREFPSITCASIDLPYEARRSRWRAARRPGLARGLLDQLEAELLAEPRSASVALRRAGRFEPELERLELPEAPSNGHGPLRPRGVYLVTGGLGGIGLAIARHFARTAGARVVLVGRSALPARAGWEAWLAQHGSEDPISSRIRAIQECEAAGGELAIARADVTDVEAMRAVIEGTRQRFGALHGVVHAAGVLRDAPLLSKSQQELEEVLAAKVHGTLVLDSLLADAELDFFAVCSSVSGLVAPAGQVDYAAASAFLDAYACSASARSAGKPRRRRTVSIDWGIWRDVGMAARAVRAERDGAAGDRAAGAAPHALFDAREQDPDAPLVLRARYAPSERWVLDEHRTREGRALLPGSAYVELARAIAAESGAPRELELRDLLLLAPLHVRDGESREVEVELRPGAGGSRLTVKSRAAAEAWETHAEGTLASDAPARASPVDLAEIRARCPVRRASEQGLASAQEHRVQFGPRWRTLREVRAGRGEILATLELDPAFASDLETCALHPALLDIASTCALELPELELERSPKDSLWVPMSYRRVRVYGPMPRRVHSWVRSREQNGPDSSVLLFDVVVTDERGRPCVEIDEFALHGLRLDLDQATAQRAAAAAFGGDRGAPAPAHADGPGRASLARNARRGIEVRDGVEALHRILAAREHAQVIATSLDVEGLRRQAELASEPARSPAAGSAGFERPEPASDYVEPRDGIERTLAGFWQEVLGVRRVGARDDFFALGGHSLIAVRLFARIKQTFQVDFPISLLFEAPTVERCAAAIRAITGVASAPAGPSHSPAETRYRSLVAMHPGQGGPRTPFVLVAGMFGNVLNLRHLAHLLGSERRFFGLQALGLYGAAEPRETFEEMARDYLEELRRVQPRGPYLLGGFSGGGITAYEMARQLREDGEEVALLAMLDTALPRAPELTAHERAQIHWQRLCARGPGYVREWALDRWSWELARLKKLVQRPEIRQTPSEFRSAEVGAAFLRALQVYELQPLDCAVTLFRPRLQVAHVLSSGRRTNARREFVEEDNGWGAWVPHVEVHEVPGDHDSMVLEPNVRVLATRLKQCIEAVESPRRLPRTPIEAGGVEHAHP